LAKDLQHQTRTGLPLTPIQQVLIALRFYATGTFQRVIGDLFGVSVFAACGAIRQGFQGYCAASLPRRCSYACHPFLVTSLRTSAWEAIAQQKRQFLSIPGNLADVKGKLWAAVTAKNTNVANNLESIETA